jgi:hypothetical protein
MAVTIEYEADSHKRADHGYHQDVKEDLPHAQVEHILLEEEGEPTEEPTHHDNHTKDGESALIARRVVCVICHEISHILFR